MKKHRIKPPPKEELERAYTDERRTSQNIGRMYQCSGVTVLKWLHMYNIHVRTNSETHTGIHVGEKHVKYIEPPPKEELERLYLEELKTIKEIGAIFGCSSHPVRKWLGMYNINKRTPSEARVGKCAGKDNPAYIEPPPKEVLERLYLEELKTPNDIGKLFNCTPGPVIKWLRRYNIPIRTSAIVMREIYNGENNHMWRGGSSFEPYCHKFNETFKEKIRDKFNRTCFLCPTTEQEQMDAMSSQGKRAFKLSVHHVSYDKDCLCDDSECEFVPLCDVCHGKTNHNREYWENMILDKLTS